ncbi:MAG: 50S ribosomal protein L1 [Ardenticatenaceae bacterium]
MGKKSGKNYKRAAALVDPNKVYDKKEAVELIKDASFAKFDETVEIHLRTTLDQRKADQQLRGTVLLPHGTGKQVRILVFADGEDIPIAEAAGADYVGGQDLVKKIQGGWLEFDVALATPAMMRFVGRLGRVLGPRGLMPNPKAGTVVKGDGIGRVIGETRKGRVEFRLDRTANIHVGIGKVSFTVDQIIENLDTLLDAISASRPSGAKGPLMKRITLSSTMGPGIKIEEAL